jgi:predicted phosphate transport protein (TIGR00153 family)
MFGWLLPRETTFFDFFERHAAMTVQGAQELLSLASTGTNVVAKAKRIKEIEHECDTITHHCVEALHKTFITPIERDDIYQLISRMDDIMDYVEAAAERIALYKLTAMTRDLKDLADVLVRATEELAGTLTLLRNLENAPEISKRCIDINRLENEADAILRAATARLFDEEQDVRNIIKWKEIYENLENATDRCEDVANIIEGVVLEHA